MKAYNSGCAYPAYFALTALNIYRSEEYYEQKQELGRHVRIT